MSTPQPMLPLDRTFDALYGLEVIESSDELVRAQALGRGRGLPRGRAAARAPAVPARPGPPGARGLRARGAARRALAALRCEGSEGCAVAQSCCVCGVRLRGLAGTLGGCARKGSTCDLKRAHPVMRRCRSWRSGPPSAGTRPPPG